MSISWRSRVIRRILFCIFSRDRKVSAVLSLFVESYIICFLRTSTRIYIYIYEFPRFHYIKRNLGLVHLLISPYKYLGRRSQINFLSWKESKCVFVFCLMVKFHNLLRFFQSPGCFNLQCLYQPYLNHSREWGVKGQRKDKASKQFCPENCRL